MYRVLAAPAVLALAACVTVNLSFSFPPKEMAAKFKEMEDKVRATDEQPKNQAAAFDPVPDPQERPNFNVDTPATKEINERRTKRFADLKAHFAAGRIGEGKDGRVVEREAGDLTGKAKADFNKVVKAENEDRDKVLAEVMKVNKIQDGKLNEVRKAYSIAMQAKAELGWWIESPKGTWVKKEAKHKEKLDKNEPIED